MGIVNAVLGLAPPPFSGPLTRIERGVLIAVLATLVTQLGLAPGLTVGGEPVSCDSWCEAIYLSVGLGAARGFGCLAMTEGFVEGLCRAGMVRAVAPSAQVELAATYVAQADLAGAATGDAVVFDETVARPANEDWPVRARCGEKQASAWWLPDGRLLAREEQPTLNEAITRPERVAAIGAGAATRGRAEISVRAVVIGSAFRFDANGLGITVARNAPVALEVDGKAWAYGEPPPSGRDHHAAAGAVKHSAS